MSVDSTNKMLKRLSAGTVPKLEQKENDAQSKQAELDWQNLLKNCLLPDKELQHTPK